LPAPGDERFADFLAALGTNWDVLQVGLLRIEPASRCHHLIVGGVDATGLWPNGRRQSISVRGFQLRRRAMLKQALNDLMVRGQGRQRLLVGDILAGPGLFWGLTDF